MIVVLIPLCVCPSVDWMFMVSRSDGKIEVLKEDLENRWIWKPSAVYFGDYDPSKPKEHIIKSSKIVRIYSYGLLGWYAVEGS